MELGAHPNHSIPCQDLLRAGWTLITFVLFLFFLGGATPGHAASETELAVSLPETVKGYTPCEITVISPVSGEATLELYDHLNNPWLTMRASLTAGENKIPWDGLGTNQERLFAGPYHFDVTLREGGGSDASGQADGKEWTGSAKFQINGTTPTLVYALPTSDTLYLDHGERWFVECYVSAECIVVMEVRDAAGKVAYSRETTISDPDGTILHWAGSVNDLRKVSAGAYTVRLWSKMNPSYAISFPFEVRDVAPADPSLEGTGAIIPERGMSDEEIWAIMMKPSVVIAGNGSFLRFDLYSAPNSSSRSVGSLRCATQGLEILDLTDNWAHVRAWSHTNGKEVTGYIQTRKLTVFSPAAHYGLLIDKREQTLTVYEDGKPIGTVPVSTGLATKGNAYRETPAGAFLTDVHFGASFAQEGYRYEYPLRYDAGNIIHGVGYVRSGRVRDYSHNLPLLGQKASHGCVRVSPFLTGDSPINMYWLWTHLPYHTRVIILDD